MLETLRIQNFKSWQDTGTIQFGALTGFFGTNSSGKTSILQFLLMLKQTVESSDRARILHLGDENSYVELGTLHDVIHNHADPGKIDFGLSWTSSTYLKFEDMEGVGDNSRKDAINIKYEFVSAISQHNNLTQLIFFYYERDDWQVGVRQSIPSDNSNEPYQLVNKIHTCATTEESPFGFQKPIKFYGFPNEVLSVFRNPSGLQDLVYELEDFFSRCYYLGPLREYPRRLYSWAGEQTDGVGNRGERAVAALLSSRQEGRTISDSVGKQPKHTLEQHIAYWLKKLGLIHSFAVRPIAPNRKEYEVRVQKTPDSAEVFITDVGFGVSQLLPVLVLLFYVPEGSAIILEQPEIHLHPAVQAGLADVMLDAIKRRNVQIILESHSEYLLHRLQTRLAEEVIPADKVKLYFTKFEKEASEMTALDLDEYGNIRNWPKNFFGDQFGEAAARMEQELKRRQAAGEK